VFQQPAEIPGALMPALTEPIAALKPPVLDPAQKDGEALGMVINGLTPPLSISVAPSGIVPPFNVVFALAPGVESTEAVPIGVVAPIDPQVEPTAEPNPPPSNVEFVPDIEAALDPIIPADSSEEEAVEELLTLQLETAAGLNPPGSISVAPSGIPVALLGVPDTLALGIPSGEVAPIPGLVIALCACAPVQANNIATATKGRTRIERLLTC
jgi:hypothetical protein